MTAPADLRRRRLALAGLAALAAALVVAPLVLGAYGATTLARMLVFALFAASLDRKSVV